MLTKRMLAVLAVAIIAVIALGVFAEDAHAQQSVLERESGIGGLMEGRGLDADRAPETWQVVLGVGSIFVMLAVVKFL